MAAAVSAACDKVALTAPTDTTITLFANANAVPLNGSMEVTASVIEPAGTPVQNGTLVTFTTTIGSIDPREARTQDGKATVRFVAGSTSGTAKISAFSGSAKAAADLELKVGGASATRIVLSATPSSVPATGGAVELLATVLDADGNRVTNVAVSFSTSAGTLSAATVFTDGNGEAKTGLTTTRQATVTATAGAVTSPATLTVNVNPSPTITITVTPPTGQTTLIAGVPANFTFAITSGDAALSNRRLFIDFDDGERLTLDSPSASTTLAHTYAEPRAYRVVATVTNVNGDSSTATLVVSVLPPTGVTVTLEVQGSCPRILNGVQLNAAAELRVALSPSTNITVVTYEWSFGDGESVTLPQASISHIYTTPGNKTVRVTVVLADGRRLPAERTIIVAPATSCAVQ